MPFYELIFDFKIIHAILLGTLGWIEKHERIKQLAIQSVIQALSNREETVKEALITHEKLRVLVHELILVELWREVVLPEMLKEKMSTSFCIYPILYHESSCINLLETVLYHSEAAETLEDAGLDLADYCLRTLNYFVSTADFDEEDEEAGGDNKGEQQGDIDMKKQSESLLLGISMKCLTTIRYIIDNIDKLGNGLVSRLVVSSDTPMLLTELIIRKPWRREYWREGKILDFDPTDNRWKEKDPSTRMLIGSTEVQAWLGLYILLKNNQILSAYEIYESRKNQLLKLRPYLNELTLDQIPILTEFQLFLNQLAVTSGPFGPSRSPLLLEMVPPIRDALEEQFTNNRKKILEASKREFVTGSKEAMVEKAKRLAAVYDFDNFEAALPVVKPCANCGKDASKKCSKCKDVWYCGRDCQIQNWTEHKKYCANNN